MIKDDLDRIEALAQTAMALRPDKEVSDTAPLAPKRFSLSPYLVGAMLLIGGATVAAFPYLKESPAAAPPPVAKLAANIDPPVEPIRASEKNPPSPAPTATARRPIKHEVTPKSIPKPIPKSIPKPIPETDSGSKLEGKLALKSETKPTPEIDHEMKPTHEMPSLQPIVFKQKNKLGIESITETSIVVEGKKINLGDKVWNETLIGIDVITSTIVTDKQVISLTD